jgi:hypothetical protein
MHTIIRQSLLASIQTIRAVLLGMEAILRTPDEENKRHLQVVLDDDEISKDDEKRIAEVLGIKELLHVE